MSHPKRPGSLRSLHSFSSGPSSKSTLALGISVALLATNPVLAQQEVINLDTLSIEDRTSDSNPYAEPGAPYKAKKSADERYRREIAKTPKNISVLTKTQIEDSGYTDLREILDAQPGITLGTGENGNAFGDRYIIRGQEARSDVFVDGLRDPGMTIRESFATEQVEVSKGPDSSFGGRGTTGGAVNSITKKASTDYDFTKLSTAIGSDNHQRVAIDANHVIDFTSAIRLNVLSSYEEVPDRAPAERERQGAALSYTKDLTENLSLHLDHYYLEGRDRPDMGYYMLSGATGEVRQVASNVPVYAQLGDFLDSIVQTTTARFSYEIDPALRVTNSTRIGTTENGYLVTGARGDNTEITRLSTHNGWQEVEYIVNSTNLYWDLMAGATKHELSFGFEYSDHNVVNGVYDNLGSESKAAPYTFDDFQLNTIFDRSAATRQSWDQDWTVKTASLSVMDTVEINDHWTVHGGIRQDFYDFELKTQDLRQTNRDGTTNTNYLTVDTYRDDDSITNYHLGIAYQLNPQTMLYFSHATASDINGGESDVGTSAGYGGFVTSSTGITPKPEKLVSYELGAKWNVFDNKMLATVALFQINKSDINETSGSGYESGGSYNTGESEVHGIEFGLAGNITERLSAQAGITAMKSEILNSATAANIGKDLSNFADTTATAQLKYEATDDLSIGGASKFESERKAGQPDSAGSDTLIVPGYTVFDLFANYRISSQANVRMNVGNVTNKDYYLAAYRSGSFVYKGDARNVRVTLNYDF